MTGSGQGSKSPPEDDWFDLLDEAPAGAAPKPAAARAPETSAHTKVTPVAVNPMSPTHAAHNDDLWDWEIDPKPPKVQTPPKDSGPKTMAPPEAFDDHGPEVDLMDLSVNPFSSGNRSLDTVRPDVMGLSGEAEVEEIDAADFNDTENWQFDPIAAATPAIPPPGFSGRITPISTPSPVPSRGTLPFPEPDPMILAQQNAGRVASALDTLEFESNRPPPPESGPAPAPIPAVAPAPTVVPEAFAPNTASSTLDLVRPSTPLPRDTPPATPAVAAPSPERYAPITQSPPSSAGSIRASMASARPATARFKATQAFVPPLPPGVPSLPGVPPASAPSELPPPQSSLPHATVPSPAPVEVPPPPGATRASSPPVSPPSARTFAAPVVHTAAPAESEAAPDRRADMRARFDAGDFAGALLLAESILQSNPRDPDARQVSDVCRQKLRGIYAGRLGNLQQIPRVIVPHSELRWLSLDHRAGFILSLIDGSLTLEDIIDVSSMPALEVLRTLYNLSVQRVIELRPPRR